MVVTGCAEAMLPPALDVDVDPLPPPQAVTNKATLRADTNILMTILLREWIQ
jgi:hypothetical protein